MNGMTVDLCGPMGPATEAGTPPMAGSPREVPVAAGEWPAYGTPLAVSSDARVERCTFGDAVRTVLLNEPARRDLPSGVTRQIKARPTRTRVEGE